MNQPTSAPHYRVRQFFRALAARVSEEDLEQIACVLTPASLALFRSMAIQDQRHCLDVYTTLRQAGHTNQDLLAAALLHDVGKAAARLPAWQRAIIVLLEHFAPRLLVHWSEKETQDQTLSLPKGHALSLPKGWRRPFAAHARHPEVGARWAQEAGCSPLTAALIRRHQDRTSNCQAAENQLLTLLQTADNLN